jgi:hypothetical protein
MNMVFLVSAESLDEAKTESFGITANALLAEWEKETEK